jgi:hypothetical protein
MRDEGIIEDDEQVELIDGQLMRVRPNVGRHTTTVATVAQVLTREAGEQADVRVRQPVSLTAYSEAVPDIVLVRPDTVTDGPIDAGTVLLVVEVTDRAARYDRDVRGQLYNLARIPEFWLLHRRSGGVYRYSRPGDTGYSSAEWYGRRLAVGTHGIPGLSINVLVQDLLQ